MKIGDNLKKRIALFVPTLGGGGAEKVMVNIAHGFLEAGHTVDFVLAKKVGHYVNELPADLNIVDLGAKHTSLTLISLSSYLRRVNPDVILSAMDYANIVSLWAKKISRAKTLSVISEHSILSRSLNKPPNFRSRLALPLLMRISYPMADKIVAVSGGIAKDISRSLNISKQKITVIYNPMRFDDILKKAREPIDHPWYHPGEPPVLLSVGRLHPCKDYPTLFQAFLLARKKVNIRLIILGEGEERGSLESLARRLKINQYVDMPGFMKNPYNFMAASKVFVLSSQFEGFSNALIEAIACRCPAVSTDCPSGPKEIFKKTGVGRLVPVGKPDLLANAILEALQKGEKRKPDFRAFYYEDLIKQYMRICGLYDS